MFRDELRRTHSGFWRKSAAAALGTALSAMLVATPAFGLSGSQSGPPPVIPDDSASADPADLNRPLPCPEPIILPVQGSMALAADPTIKPLNILFDPVTFQLTPQGSVALDELGTALNSEQLGPFRFAAIAHVEPLGDRSREKKVTVLMAKAITDYLVDLRNVDPDRLSWSACGASQPAEFVTYDHGHIRRVVITNLGER